MSTLQRIEKKHESIVCFNLIKHEICVIKWLEQFL